MLQLLINLLFPLVCAGCEREGKYLCDECKSSLQAHPELCPACHTASPGGRVCYGCRDDLDGIDAIQVAFQYQSLIKKLILDLKFHHKYDTGAYLGAKLALLIQSNPLYDATRSAITYVPSHRWRRHVQKGYNQSQILAQTVADQLGVPLYALSYRDRYTRSQTTLSRARRKTNLINTFKTSTDSSLPSHIKTLYIVDDIVTTGSTLSHLGRTLRQLAPSGCRMVGSVVARNMS